MKIGLISDIHCNLPGLERALELLQDCEAILCAGDLMYQYRFSNQVLALLRNREIHAIVGNHDKTILYTRGHPLQTSASVDPRERAYLAGLPSNLTLRLSGTRVAMFHGSPWDDVQGCVAHYIYPQNRDLLKRVAQVEADVIVLGHTHLPFCEVIDGRLVVNPGSCGESRDPSGDLSCAMLDTDTAQVDFRSFTVDQT